MAAMQDLAPADPRRRLIAPPPSRLDRARGDAGFTLVGLLVALSVRGLLAVVVFGVLRFGSRVWETAERVDADAATIGATQTLLRQKIAAAYPILTRATDRERHVDFD